MLRQAGECINRNKNNNDVNLTKKICLFSKSLKKRIYTYLLVRYKATPFREFSIGVFSCLYLFLFFANHPHPKQSGNVITAQGVTDSESEKKKTE